MNALKVRLSIAGLALGLLSLAAVARADTDQPSVAALTGAVNQYLSDHGDLCLGKFTWPRIVTAQDLQNKTNDAVQLPVLERLGLVTSTAVAATKTPTAWTPDAGNEPAKSYSLTAKGRRYYLRKRHVTVGAHDRPAVHDGDFCAGHVSLDKVVKWSPPEQIDGHLETVVHYTYHFKAADWMADPEAREVFPVVDRIMRREGNMLMSVTVRLEDGEWRPVLPTR
jgi:hypothetical protein